MRRIRIWLQTGRSFKIGSLILAFGPMFAGAFVLDVRLEASIVGGFWAQVLIAGLGGWYSLLKAEGRLNGVWPSLGTTARERARVLLKQAGRWVWAYCLVWSALIATLVLDCLPYRNPGLWVAGGVVWCIGLWTALRIRANLQECLSTNVGRAQMKPDSQQESQSCG